MLLSWFAKFVRRNDAAASVEYAVVLALILMAVFAAIGAVGAKSGGLWSGVVTSIQSAEQ